MESDPDEPDTVPPEHTFVLRLRNDPAADRPLRATIRHLPSGVELSTSDLTEVEDFVRLRIDGGEPTEAG